MGECKGVGRGGGVRGRGVEMYRCSHRYATLVPALITIYSTGIGLRDPYSSSKLL